MKKLTLGLALILSGVMGQASAAYGPSRYCVSVPSLEGGFTVGFAGLYLRSEVPYLDYALSFPVLFTETEPLASTVNGTVHTEDPGYEWGFRVNIGYVLPCTGNDVNLTYTHFDQEDLAAVENPGAVFAGQFEGGVVHERTLTVSIPALDFTAVSIPPTPNPGTIYTGITEAGSLTASISGQVNLVSAKADFKNNTWDLDAGQYMNVGRKLRLHWYAGLRYSKLKHSLESTIQEAVGSVPEDGVDVSFFTNATLPGITTGFALINFHMEEDFTEVSRGCSQFDGMGPRIGLDGRYHLGCGFGVVSSFSTALLAGRIDSEFNDLFTVSTKATATPLTKDDEVNENLVGSFGLFSSGNPDIDAKITEIDPSSVTNVIRTEETHFRYPHETRFVPNIDAKIALDWSTVFCNCSHTKLTFEAGYQVSHFFNAVDRLTLSGILGPEFNTRRTVDMSFSGPYVGVQVKI